MTAEDRREDLAEALARKMAEDDRPGTWEPLLSYVRALIQAEKALDDAALRLRLAAGCITRDETRIAAHVNADAATAALLALRAVIGEP